MCKEERFCPICGKKLLPRQKYCCSKKCFHEWKYPYDGRTCEICGAPLTKDQQKYCSNKCYGISKRNTLSPDSHYCSVERLCKICGKPLTTGQMYYCSNKCRIESRKTKEVRYCKRCGKRIYTNYDYCKKCNAEIKKEKKEAERKNKVCIICGAPLPRGRYSYCSDECKREGINRRQRSNHVKKEYLVTCEVCGKEFISNKKNAKYCSTSCREIGLKNKKTDYYMKNREDNRRKCKEYYLAHKEYCSQYHKEYRKRNRERENARRRNLYNTKMKFDVDYMLHKFVRRMVHRCIKTKKSRRTIDILGYSAMDLKEHLESLFHDGMSWENRKEWEVHHIKPLYEFNLVNEDGSPNYDAIREANALENLVPLYKGEHSKITADYLKDIKRKS